MGPKTPPQERRAALVAPPGDNPALAAGGPRAA
jgi:hypothetical protein